MIELRKQRVLLDVRGRYFRRGFVGVVCILVISVDVHSYFTGIALLIIPTTNTKLHNRVKEME